MGCISWDCQKEICASFISYLLALINVEVSGMEVRIASLQDSLPHNMRVNPQSPTAEESSWRRRGQACWPRWQTRQCWWRRVGQAGGWKQLRCRIRCRIMWELPRPRDGLPSLLPQTIPQSTPISRQIHFHNRRNTHMQKFAYKIQSYSSCPSHVNLHSPTIASPAEAPRKISVKCQLRFIALNGALGFKPPSRPLLWIGWEFRYQLTISILLHRFSSMWCFIFFGTLIAVSGVFSHYRVTDMADFLL